MLCLHGFTGTPFEIQPVTDALGRRGYSVDAPLLAGHGVDLAALEMTGWPDWLRSAEQAFDALATRTVGRIAVVGFSMGGLLALRLATSRGSRIAALAILAAPLRLRPSQVRGIQMLGRIPRMLRFGPLRAVPKLFGSDVSDRQARGANPALSAMPLVGLLSLLELMAEVRAGLSAIRAPALVVHGRKDRTVPISDSFELADRLTGDETGRGIDGQAPIVERLWLERSCHLVGVDVEREMLSEAVGRFLETRGHW